MPTGSRSEINTFKGEERALRADRIGTPGLAFSVIAAAGPLLSSSAIITTGYGVIGTVGQPVIFVVIGVTLVLFSIGYAEMSRHVHNAGAFYAYITRGLGSTAGTAAAFVALVAYSVLQFALYGLFGFQLSYMLEEYAGLTVQWWVSALVGLAFITVLGARKIDLNTKVLGVVLVLEVGLILVCDIAFVADPGPQGVTLAAFDVGDALGSAGIGTALCFAISAFAGFESAPVYAEETQRPHAAVGRAVFVAVGVTASIYALTAWAMSVAAGPAHIVAVSQELGPGVLPALGEERLGAAVADVVNFFLLSGIFATMLSFHNTVARYFFAMGREGLLPRAVGRTSRASGAPAIGSLAQSAISLVAVAVFATAGKDPVTEMLAWCANVGSIGLILLMSTTSVAVVAFFWRRGVARAQAWRLACAALSAIILLCILVMCVRQFDVLLGADPSSALAWILPSLMFAVAALGLGFGLLLKARRPELHVRIGLGNEAFRLETAAASEAGTGARA